MAAKPDPYQAWLGIPPGARPPNHYQLLGLDLFESEPPVIAEAADERIDKIQALTAGPQGEVAKRLLQQLTAARKVLLSAATRRAYDAELRAKLGMAPAAAPKVPPNPVANAAAPAAAIPAAAVPMAAQPVAAMPAAQSAMPRAAVPMAGIPMAAVPMATAQHAVPVAAMPMAPMMAQAVPMAGVPQAAAAVADLAFQDNSSESTYRPRFRRQTSSGSWALLAIGFLLIAGLAGGAFVFKDKLLAALEDQPEPVQVAHSGTTHVPPTQPPTTTQPSMNPITAAARAGGANRANPQPGGRDMANVDLSNPNLVDRPLPNTQAMGMNSGPPRQDMGVNRPAVVTPPKPKPKPTAPQVLIPSLSKAPTADEKAAVAKSLAAVRKALGERNRAKAAEQLNLATLEAASPDSLAAVDRMKTLESALDAFWKAVGEGIKGLKTVDELNYDGMTAVVINAEPTSLSIRVEGQSKEYKIDKLPTGLAYHLAERWLNEGDPQTKVILGSFLYVEPKGDHEKARQLWEQAASQGADVAKLLVQLDLDLASEAGK